MNFDVLLPRRSDKRQQQVWTFSKLTLSGDCFFINTRGLSKTKTKRNTFCPLLVPVLCLPLRTTKWFSCGKTKPQVIHHEPLQILVQLSQCCCSRNQKETSLPPKWQLRGLIEALVCLLSPAHACAHTHAHTNTHTHMHTRIHTRTHIHRQLATGYRLRKISLPQWWGIWASPETMALCYRGRTPVLTRDWWPAGTMIIVPLHER